MRHLASPLALSLMLSAPAAAQVAEPLSPIRMNQLGFETGGPKVGVLPHAATEPLAWELIDASGTPRLAGRTRVFGPDKASGEHVHLIEFGGFTTAGEGWRLRAGGAESRVFAIGQSPTRGLAKDALAFFYHQRAGVPIEARFVGERWARPAGHPQEVAACFAGADQRGTVWPGCSDRIDLTGGWYDAGDHGKYVVNGGISLWTLLHAYERASLLGTPIFADGSAAIPEAGNGVSDLLDEARFQMEFMLRMQVRDGTRTRVHVGPAPTGEPRAALTLSEVDASGMAYHKVADRNWTALPMPPQDDPQERLVYPPSTTATLNLAATAAQCARLWKGVDDAFAARCLAAAERAWSAAMRNPQVYAVGDFTGSGGYGDGDATDEFYWAAAELLATTGKAEYLAFVRASPHFAAPVTEPGWPRVASLGTLALLGMRGALTEPERAGLRQRLLNAADSWVGERGRVGYAVPYDVAGYPWGSTSNLLNRAMLLATAYDMTGQPKYRAAVIDAVDYVLGRNPLDQSYVSGYGARPMRNPHHRFWANVLDPGLPPPPPGALSGGPNSTSMGDDVAKAMRGKCAPMTCWADDVRAYALNEVAINWNAPLFWVASWLEE